MLRIVATPLLPSVVIQHPWFLINAPNLIVVKHYFQFVDDLSQLLRHFSGLDIPIVQFLSILTLTPHTTVCQAVSDISQLPEHREDRMRLA